MRISEGVELPVIGLITDFGLADGYVGEMHDAIYLRCRDVRIIDITHDIKPGDVSTAAYFAWRAGRLFAQGSVIVVVVDPGVGSGRQAVVVRCMKKLFVAPDNGALSHVIGIGEAYRTRVVDFEDVGEKPNSNTFHGRDLFAPVAALLAAGASFSQLGKTGVLKDTPQFMGVQKTNDGWLGEVVHIDRFGNAATTIPNADGGFIETPSGARLRRLNTYAEGGKGEAFWLCGSDGRAEIAVNGGSAAETLRLDVGDKVNWVLPV